MTSRQGEMKSGNDDGGAAGSGKTKSGVSAAGHTYDKGYDKWAKFDVDAALRSVDGDDARMDEKVRVTLIGMRLGQNAADSRCRMESSLRHEKWIITTDMYLRTSV